MITKKIQQKILALILLLLLTLSFSPGFVNAQDNYEDNKVIIYFFWGDGCPHCATEKPYLEEWQEKYGDNIEIKSFETWKDQSNVPLFQQAAQAYGIQARGVPTTFIGEKNWIGFSSSMAPEMENYIQSCIEEGCENLAKNIDFSEEDDKASENNNETNKNNSYGFLWIIFFVLVILVGIFISIKILKKPKVDKTKINNKKEKTEK